MTTTAELIQLQAATFEEIRNIQTSFKKDSASRKTPQYISDRLENLDQLWQECQRINEELQKAQDKSHQYFTDNIFEVIAEWYVGTRKALQAVNNPEPVNPNAAGTSENKVDPGEEGNTSDVVFDTSRFLGEDIKLAELKQLQNANFRALKRYVENIPVDNPLEKWEIEDKLKILQSRWNAVENIHLQIDSITNGTDIDYYDSYMLHELKYERTKKGLHSKLSTSIHQQQALPKLEIPQFFGNYTQWPTFKELYSEAIHNNPALTKTQKMQHLKGKLKGEAEKLVQHLQISAENYDVCWDLLTHRYNNKQLLFTKQFQTFMRQPTIQKQSAFELKRMYDTSMETIHAIHNLGVDTTSWDPMFVHILCEKLDTDTYADYMEMRAQPRELPSFEEFMGFIEAKFTALEPLTKRRSDNNPTRQVQGAYKPPQTFNRQAQPPSKHTKPFQQPTKSAMNPHYNYNYHVHSNKIKCPLCNDDHALFQCKRFLSMSATEQIQYVTKANICKNCLYVHTQNYCKSEKRCKECNEAHNTVLHKAMLTQPMKQPTTSIPQSTPLTSTQKVLQNNFVASSDDEILLPTALLQVTDIHGNDITLRSLIDQGSQISLITEAAAQLLGLKRKQLRASVSGVGTLSNKSKGKVTLHCKSLHNDFEFTTDALIMTRVVSNLPSASFAGGNCEQFDNITLADPNYNKSSPIDLLLDVDVYTQIMMSGLVKLPNMPMAQQTKLGWILSGAVKTYNCHVVINDTEDLAKYWEIEDITDNNNLMTSQEEYCEKLFTTTTRRLENGRYEVRLPLKENFTQLLGESKPQAIAQYRQLEKKLIKDEQLSTSYNEFIQEYLRMGHMKESPRDADIHCYLPHHGIMKPDSWTTRLRVVFNASQKTSTGHSLNDLMECGPKLHQDLQALLIQWRHYRFVISSDCEKMYRMILVHEDDQHLQKIVWRNTPNQPLKQYALTTVSYGQKAAPYLALRTLKQLAQDDSDSYPLAANVINNEMYVDDVLTGSNDINQALEIQQQLIHMLQGAGFNLRKWTSNNPTLLEKIPQDSISPNVIDFNNAHTTKTLGLQWNPARDTFTFKNTLNDTPREKLSKRVLLSEISKIFDPLGFLNPVTIKAKLLFQNIWQSNCDWDDIVPENVQNDWLKFTVDIRNIENIEIPRWLGDMTKAFEIHGFCDASEKAYSCVIYARTVDAHNEPVVRLIAAKTRLAPINQSQKQTLPRLELCATVLLARLMKKVIQAFKWEHLHDNTYAWTDSMIVLGYLQGNPEKWKTFVSNRVKQVHDVIPSAHWNHVRSEDNAADCATRGLSVSQLQSHSLWWHGPTWLKHFDKTSIAKKVIVPTANYESKIKQTCIVQSEPPSLIMELLSRHSNMTHITRVLAWILRFIAIMKAPQLKLQFRLLYLTVAELINAETIIIKHIQHYEFSDDINRLRSNKTVSAKSNILKLDPFLDANDILRVGGRLNNSSLTKHAKNPALLSRRSRLTELLVQRAHLQMLHGGPKLTLTHLRKKYWIIGGYQAVKALIHLCVTCRRFNAKPQQQIMADLPSARVTPARPFLHAGVDFTGFVDIKANKGRGIKTLKAYIAVFVCFVTKGVHLELVSELSSSAFLAAFLRFTARRGEPKHMYSDNGTNFVGANRQLLQERKQILNSMDNTVLTRVAEEGTTWHFNAPAWPTGSGLMEAAVKSAKYHMKRVLGDQKLTFEEFSTLLCQIEACLNSRPLCPLTENIEDLRCLTPGHLLILGDAHLTVPEATLSHADLRNRWQRVQKLAQGFWQQWSNEYLQHLQERNKWQKATEDLQVNDIVCIRGNQPIGRWALGRIIDTHPGKDGHTRVVTLKTENGTMKRPITQLVPLVTHENDKKADIDNPAPLAPAPKTTSSRRATKLSWTTLTCLSLLLFVTLVTPTAQSAPKRFALTPLNSDQTLYFDKLTDMQEIKDDWKVVIYYNMSNYWQNVDALDRYVTHIKQYVRPTWIAQFQITFNQLQQDLKELHYYNTLLKYQPLDTNRFKRGLVDGVGYLANTLFGVLDERFAEKYENDIQLTRHNEQHLLQLIKNQTSIIEAEGNILKRNEEIMNKQFQIITAHMNALANETEQVRNDNENAFYIMTSTIAANSMLQHLKSIQQTVINTLTNMYHGQVDVHLLSPIQLQIELNRIARHLSSQLALPDAQDNIRNLYKLLRINARITNQYLIMEAKIPLLSDEQFELDKLISIPQHISSQNTIHVIPGTEIIAFNINRDTFIPMEQSDLNACPRMDDQKLLCHLNHPVYDIKQGKSICNTEIITARKNHDSYCHTETKPCTDSWIKLHKQNTWMYTCCDKCLVRILCPDGVASQVLWDNGLLTLDKGCVMKGDTFMLYANKNYIEKSVIDLDTDITYQLPAPSELNYIVNTSLHHMTYNNETHDQQFKNIHRDLQLLKTQTHLGMSSHDQYQYATIGTSLTISIIMILVGSYLYFKHRAGRGKLPGSPQQRADDKCDDLNRETIECVSVSEPVPSARKATTSAKQVVFDTSTDF